MIPSRCAGIVLVLVFIAILAPRRVEAQPMSGDSTRLNTPGQFGGDSTKSAIDSLGWLNGYLRLRERIRSDSLALRYYLDSLDNTPMAIMRRNLTFSYKDWAPSAAAMAFRDEEIKRSQGWDQVFRNIPRVGVSIPLQGIARALGLAEDVSPRISYTLMHTQHVSVKVYDLTAHVVDVLYDDIQAPGQYRFDWNMQDSTGQRVETGNYVAEVVVEAGAGSQLLLRKRIEVP